MLAATRRFVGVACLVVVALIALVCGPSASVTTAQASCTAAGATLQAPYCGTYSLLDLGSVPGVPSNYGGLSFLPSDPNFLIIGGQANTANGKLYKIGVVR